MILLERASDPLTPLLHEFTYQCMIYDLLNIEKDRFQQEYTDRSGERATRDCLLDESDPLWPMMRHLYVLLLACLVWLVCWGTMSVYCGRCVRV